MNTDKMFTLPQVLVFYIPAWFNLELEKRKCVE